MAEDAVTSPKRCGTDAEPLAAHGLGIRLAGRDLGLFTFDVAPGEMVCLLGSNGSGKTTAIRLALGLVRARVGQALVFGHAVSPTSPPKGLGYVPDRADFWNWQTAENNLTPFAAERDAVPSILERVGLSAAAGQPVRRFSRGMRQRLSIARALLTESALLVMDEPTIALDVDGVDLLCDLLTERRAAGGATLVATHDQSFLGRIGGRVVRVENGMTT